MEGKINKKLINFLKRKWHVSEKKLREFLTVFGSLQESNRLLAFNILGFDQHDIEKFSKEYRLLIEAYATNYGIYTPNKCLQLSSIDSNDVSYFNNNLGRFFASNGTYSIYLRVPEKLFDNGQGETCSYGNYIPPMPPVKNVTYNGQTIPNAWGLGQLDIYKKDGVSPYRIYFVYTEHNSAAPGAFIVGRYGVYPDGNPEYRILEVFNIPRSLIDSLIGTKYINSDGSLDGKVYLIYLGNQ